MLPAVLVLTTAAMAFSGCSARRQPFEPSSLPAPELTSIHRAMRQTIDRLEADPRYEWVSGFWGNIKVNSLGGPTRGLCYEWQEVIYAGVTPTLRDVGWHATGVAVNEGRPGEHHAVVVYDPRIVPEDQLLTRPTAAYVLDAWKRGEPDIYRLSDWLANEKHPEYAARIERLTITPFAASVFSNTGASEPSDASTPTESD
jgi:hypothetical protein